MASQIAIKQPGTNGGGFFNVNSAHPFENSTPFNNFVETWAILVLPFAFAFTFGRMVKDKRQGYAVFAIMFVVWIAMSTMAMVFEGNGNPEINAAGASQTVTSTQGGGNMEGKEIRFGPAASGRDFGRARRPEHRTVRSTRCTTASRPSGGVVPMSHMMLGEVSPGGVGVGLSGLLVMAILSVFIAGLMVGRTPEYLGKKIQAPEMKMVALYVLAMPTAVLAFTAASLMSRLSSTRRSGTRGSTASARSSTTFTSAGNNNGSAFAGITAATTWMDTTMGIAMLMGRFFLVLPVLALAGAFARKRVMPATVGTFPTHTPLFVGLVIGVVVIVGGLTFFPAVALGPLVEQLSL